MKVVTVVGTRPEIIRLSRVLCAFDRWFDHKIVHTGQNYDYELNQIFFDDLGLRKPDHFLNAAVGNAAATVGAIIAAADAVLAEEEPDAVLILGDTNSALSAYPAKRRKIPVFHMEAGNRCFDQRVPEEINRKIVDHMSDVNLPYSDISRDYLLREGFPPDRVIKTGSPMFEVLHYYKSQIDASDVLTRMALAPRDYFVISSHREENIDDPRPFSRLVEFLNRLGERFEKRIIFSTHPRTRRRIESSGVQIHPLVELMKPLGFFDYNALQINARVVFSDSGTINEESSILNFPAVNLRTAHERPEAMEEGGVPLTSYSWPRIETALEILESQGRGSERTLRLVADYSMPNVSEKVARIVLGYTDYVNRYVWHKND